MPSTRRQKVKARRSREADILSDIENMDVMLGISENELADHISENMTHGSNSLQSNRNGTNSARRDNSSQENEFLNVDVGNYQNLNGRVNRDANLDFLSGEMNNRISRELDNFMGTVNSQIQRAVEEAITSQILPQIRSSLRNIEETVGINNHVHEEPEPRSEDLRPRDQNVINNNFNNGSSCTLDRSTHGASHYIP